MGILGQQIHLTPQFVLIHAGSSRGCAASAATATTSPSTAAATAGRASIVVVPATPSGWHPAASPPSSPGRGSTAPSRHPSRSQGWWWWRGCRWMFGHIIGQLVVVETHRVQQGIDLIFGHVPSKNPFHDVDLSGTKRGRG